MAAAVAGLCLAGVLGAVASQVDDDLTARKRVFKPIGPGLRAIKPGRMASTTCWRRRALA